MTPVIDYWRTKSRVHPPKKRSRLGRSQASSNSFHWTNNIYSFFVEWEDKKQIELPPRKRENGQINSVSTAVAQRDRRSWWRPFQPKRETFYWHSSFINLLCISSRWALLLVGWNIGSKGSIRYVYVCNNRFKIVFNNTCDVWAQSGYGYFWQDIAT